MPGHDDATMPESDAVKSRRRGEVLEAALLDATWAELEQVGYEALTMEAVATRAGTSRGVIYRRWPERAALVIATLRRHRPMLSGPIPDTGSLRGDIVALLRRASSRLAELGPETLYGLLGDYFGNTKAFNGLQDQALQIGGDVTTAMLRRAAERGEVTRHIDPRVAALPTDLFRHEIFTTRVPPTNDVIDDIVDKIFLPLVLTPNERKAQHQPSSAAN